MEINASIDAEMDNTGMRLCSPVSAQMGYIGTEGAALVVLVLKSGRAAYRVVPVLMEHTGMDMYVFDVKQDKSGTQVGSSVTVLVVNTGIESHA